jgi:hypothetical protein
MTAETSDLETCAYVAYDCVSEYIELKEMFSKILQWKDMVFVSHCKSV